MLPLPVPEAFDVRTYLAAEADEDEEACLVYLAGQIYWELIFPAEGEHEARRALGRLCGRLFVMVNDIYPHDRPGPGAAKLVSVR